jgi:thioredoxin reductase (NADPH)
MIYDILIVGSGPSGISTAVEAKNAGLKNILILEKNETHSFSIRKLYVDGKRVDAAYKGEPAVCDGLLCIADGTKESTLETLNEFIQKHRLEIHYHSEVEKISKENDVFTIRVSHGKNYSAKTVVIAIGVFGRPNKPETKIPPSLKEHILFDITSQVIEQKKVLVVGGGNSAAEAVEFLVHQKNDVFLSYRKETFSKMNTVNEKILGTLFSEHKATPIIPSNIKELQDVNGKVHVHFNECNSVEVDKVIFQIGGTTPDNFLKAIGIDYTNGDVVINEKLETSIPGLYLAGDLIANKKGTIIKAFNTGKKIVREGICEDYLECELPT